MSLHSLQHFVRTYESDLEAELCQRLIDSFNALSRFHVINGRGQRAGLEDSAWTELNVTRMADPGFAGFFRRKLDFALERYNRDVGLAIPVPNSPKCADLILKRYRPNGLDKFQAHFDSIYDVSNRFLVFLWYLNDVAAGGATRFPQLDIAIEARRGRLLMFPPYWMYQHAGEPPASGDKYILSTYLLF